MQEECPNKDITKTVERVCTLAFRKLRKNSVIVFTNKGIGKDTGEWTHPTIVHVHESTISSWVPEEISRITYSIFLVSRIQPREYEPYSLYLYYLIICVIFIHESKGIRI